MPHHVLPWLAVHALLQNSVGTPPAPAVTTRRIRLKVPITFHSPSPTASIPGIVIEGLGQKANAAYAGNLIGESNKNTLHKEKKPKINNVRIIV